MIALFLMLTDKHIADARVVCVGVSHSGNW
jgi:hypothetical protein